MLELKEARDSVIVQSTRYQQAIRNYHSKNIRERSFAVGDLVLRNIQSMKDKHKLPHPPLCHLGSTPVRRLSTLA
ncbi:hypothetical protein Zm00014a_032585 [Zea mays]|uniref:Uncharacterized protein n=1 Tax=Zea mays TaxID=4577 RepID=A0A3L6EEW5_MAIZE|nr:hypothetical protein Zm00014a_032585 [Zea mays]